jgi:hypothetical protein
VALVDPGGTGGTLSNPPGHVVIQFINNAEVDERLLNFLVTGGGLILTDTERQSLRPRVRFRVQITFLNGVTSTFEVVDGSSTLIDQNFANFAEPDLEENDRNSATVICDVGLVQRQPETDLEVFIPTQITVFRQETLTNPEGGQTVAFTEVERIPPQFQALEVDDVDQDNNTVLLRNIGIRNTVVPVTDPLCGSVVTITMTGTLSVPFLPQSPDNSPSYDQADTPTEATIGGRYEFVVTVQ